MNKKLKLTPWFSGKAPARHGVYMRDLPNGPWFAYWNGIHWKMARPTAQAAAVVDAASTIQTQMVGWRGLASDPKEAA